MSPRPTRWGFSGVPLSELQKLAEALLEALEVR